MKKDSKLGKIYILFLVITSLISMVPISIKHNSEILIPIFVILYTLIIMRLIITIYLSINTIKNTKSYTLSITTITLLLLIIINIATNGLLEVEIQNINQIQESLLLVINILVNKDKIYKTRKQIINILILTVLTTILLAFQKNIIIYNEKIIFYNLNKLVVPLLTVIAIIYHLIKENKIEEKKTFILILSLGLLIISQYIINNYRLANYYTLTTLFAIWLIIINTKTNILISSFNLSYGGIEKALVTLLKIIKDNYIVDLVLEEKKGIYLNEISKDIKVTEYKVQNTGNKLYRKIRNLIKRIFWLLKNYKRYDSSICFATYSLPAGFLARNASNNSIYYVHSNYTKVYREDMNKIKGFFDPRKINKYNHIVFVSNESKKDLINIYRNIENKSLVINNLVDYDSIIKLSDEKIDIHKTKKTYIFIGRLEEDSKKITRILEIAKNLKKEKIEFWIIGDGENKKMYEEMIKEQDINNVLMLGAKTNPYPYLKESDYLILTSDYEGYPVVYSEALVLNKPIITTIDVTDGEVDIKDGFGYIVDKDVKEIEKVIKKTIKKDLVIKKQLDFEKINKKRLLELDKIIKR